MPDHNFTKGIKRRQFLKTAAGGLGLAAVYPTIISCQKKVKRPNIILIYTDDQRWDMMGCAGNPHIYTPNIDQLAADGVRFENAFVTTSICMASRGSAFTGLYERTHGWRDCGTKMKKEIWQNFSYPSLLRQAGYYTGFVGKFDVDVEKGGWKKPEYGKDMFDVYRPFYFQPLYFDVNGEKIHRDDLEANAALEFINNSPKDKPFCLALCPNAPHSEHVAAPRHYQRYADKTMPAPKLSEPSFFETVPEFIKTSMNRERWHWYFDTEEKYQETVKNYYGQVTGIDETVGRLRQTLKELNLDQNTLIILAGDNGYFLGDRGLAGKWLMYESSIRVPIIVYDPRRKFGAASQTSDKMALNIDLAPTILDVAGIKPPQGMHGKSLLPLVNNDQIEWRNEFFYEHRRDCPPNLNQIQSVGVRTKEWKYIRYINQNNYEELYHLKIDPDETKNIASEERHGDILNELRKKCNDYIISYKNSNLF